MRLAQAAAVAAAGLAALAAGCSTDAEPRGDARQGGSIVVVDAAAPDSVDPALASTPSALRAAWLAYTPPLTYRRAEGRDGTDLVPGLSEDLPETSDDGRTYTFAFRPGLRYSDGSPLRAHDFERAVARSLRLSPRAAALFRGVTGAAAYARGDGRSGDVAGIATDDGQRTVRIELETPDRLFPYALASLAAAPVPARTAPRDLSADPPPGIGPYRVAQVRRGGDVVLERRRSWRLPGVPAGSPQQIVTRTLPDSAERVRAVLNGRADLVQGESPARLLPDVRSTYAGRYEEHATLRSLYVAIDASRNPFRDSDVRRALAFALDAGVIDRIYDGFLEPGCNVLPPAVPGHRRLDPCPFGARIDDADLVEASRLVEQAGAAGAAVRVAAAPGDARARQLTGYLVRTLRKIGLAAQAGRGPGAGVRLAWAQPAVPHPSGYLAAVDDPVLRARVQLLEQEADAGDAEQQWADVDEEVVSRALVAPYGVATTGVLGSERLDMENCGRFHPLLGLDYSSVCVR
jgi:peptide/nickel transport system substrate-binding protein